MDERVKFPFMHKIEDGDEYLRICGDCDITWVWLRFAKDSKVYQCNDGTAHFGLLGAPLFEVQVQGGSVCPECKRDRDVR